MLNYQGVRPVVNIPHLCLPKSSQIFPNLPKSSQPPTESVPSHTEKQFRTVAFQHNLQKPVPRCLFKHEAKVEPCWTSKNIWNWWKKEWNSVSFFWGQASRPTSREPNSFWSPSQRHPASQWHHQFSICFWYMSCWSIQSIWVCLKIGYIPNYIHLIGIMISKTMGFRGILFSDKPICFFSPWNHVKSCLVWRYPARSRRWSSCKSPPRAHASGGGWSTFVFILIKKKIESNSVIPQNSVEHVTFLSLLDGAVNESLDPSFSDMFSRFWHHPWTFPAVSDLMMAWYLEQLPHEDHLPRVAT